MEQAQEQLALVVHCVKLVLICAMVTELSHQDPAHVILGSLAVIVSITVIQQQLVQVMAHAHSGAHVSVTVIMLVIDVIANAMTTQHVQDMENVHLLEPVFVTPVSMEMTVLSHAMVKVNVKEDNASVMTAILESSVNLNVMIMAGVTLMVPVPVQTIGWKINVPDLVVHQRPWTSVQVMESVWLAAGNVTVNQDGQMN